MMDRDFLLGATIDDALTEPDSGKTLSDRLTAMRMTRYELDSVFAQYLIGAAPEAVNRALDFVERLRNDVPAIEGGAAGEQRDTMLHCAEETCPRFGKLTTATDCGRKRNPAGHRTTRKPVTS